MVAVGLQFEKVNLEKMNPVKGKISVNNNLKITNVEKVDIEMGKVKRPSLKFTFLFSVNYEPKIAKMDIEGNVTVFDKPEKIEEEMNSWKKDKKVSPGLMTNVLNQVLARGNIAALVFAREVGLPPPIDLPKVNVKDTSK